MKNNDTQRVRRAGTVIGVLAALIIGAMQGVREMRPDMVPSWWPAILLGVGYLGSAAILVVAFWLGWPWLKRAMVLTPSRLAWLRNIAIVVVLSLLGIGIYRWFVPMPTFWCQLERVFVGPTEGTTRRIVIGIVRIGNRSLSASSLIGYGLSIKLGNAEPQALRRIEIPERVTILTASQEVTLYGADSLRNKTLEPIPARAVVRGIVGFVTNIRYAELTRRETEYTFSFQDIDNQRYLCSMQWSSTESPVPGYPGIRVETEKR